MDLELPSETRMLQETVRRLVREELMPLEPKALAREARGEPLTPPREELEPLYVRARELGLVGVEIGAVAKTVVTEEIARSMVPFAFPPDAPNLHMMLGTVNAAQRERYLMPYARGETVSAIAISEPDAGSDPARMKTRATRRDGGCEMVEPTPDGQASLWRTARIFRVCKAAALPLMPLIWR